MRTISAAIFVIIVSAGTYGQTCTPSSFPDSISNHPDNTGHVNGDHHDNVVIKNSCQYVDNGHPFCDAVCKLQVSQDANESGSLADIFLSHNLGKTTNTGTASAANSQASIICAGTAAAAVRSCLGSCDVSVTIKAGSDGLNATVSFPPDTMYTDNFSHATKCDPIKNTTTTTGPNDPPPPPGCGPPQPDTQGFVSTGDDPDC